MPTTTAHPVVAEVSDDGDRVNVVFKYAPERVVKIKKVPSARFVPREKGGPLWRLDLDLPTMRKLREQFGNELGLGPKLKAWGHGETTKETKLISMSQADDAELERVPARMIKGVKLKGMKKKFKLRPYQKADIRFMAETNSINANQPGAGKTIETIGAIIEAGLEWSQHLVFAPKTSLRSVWQDEILQAYQLAGFDEPVILTGDTPDQRREAIKAAKQLHEDGMAFWLLLNPAMARMKRVRQGKGDNAKFVEELSAPELAELTDIGSIIVDEFHLMGLSNPATLSSRGMKYIAEATQPERRYALSGTPMGGKPIKLWGALNFLNPGEFSSRWNWARHWLVINSNQYGSSIEGIMPGREVDFYNHLKPYLVRRTKAEALPGLPPKNRIPVWCHMTPNQAEQYKVFATEAEWRIDDAEEQGRLTATNVLAEYTRLKQFASAYCDVKKTGRDNHGIPEIKVLPVITNSGKVETLVEKLKEENVIGTSKDEDDDLKCALVFSQFKPFVYGIADYLLHEHSIPCATITGDTKDIIRNAVKNAFQEQSIAPLEAVPPRSRSEEIENLIKNGTPPRVMVLSTEAGGASITLTQADSVHILDETWVPDNQEQAEDRAHRGDDKTMEKESVRVYYYRSKGSIEEYIQKLVADKALNNKTVLDLRRRMQADLEKAEKEAAGNAK
jgi:SNF2 family DNA or RNA helicase